MAPPEPSFSYFAGMCALELCSHFWDLPCWPKQLNVDLYNGPNVVYDSLYEGDTPFVYEYKRYSVWCCFGVRGDGLRGRDFQSCAPSL